MSSFNRQHHGRSWPPLAWNQSSYHPQSTEAPHSVDPHYLDYLHFQAEQLKLQISELSHNWSSQRYPQDIKPRHKSLYHRPLTAKDLSYIWIPLVKIRNGASMHLKMVSMVMTSTPLWEMHINSVGIPRRNIFFRLFLQRLQFIWWSMEFSTGYPKGTRYFFSYQRLKYSTWTTWTTRTTNPDWTRWFEHEPLSTTYSTYIITCSTKRYYRWRISCHIWLQSYSTTTSSSKYYDSSQSSCSTINH